MKISLEITIPEEVYNRLGYHIKTVIEETLRNHITDIQQKKTNLTRSEASKRLRVSLPTLDNYIKEGKLLGHKIGRRVLISEYELELYIERKRK